jgi:hypothetical protein
LVLSIPPNKFLLPICSQANLNLSSLLPLITLFRDLTERMGQR